MPEHTPAPWEWDEEDGSIETPTGGAICHVAHHGNINTVARTGEQYSHADARLIAASPLLLAELRRLEWITAAGFTYCPSCEYLQEAGHGPSCTLVAALALIPAPATPAPESHADA